VQGLGKTLVTGNTLAFFVIFVGFTAVSLVDTDNYIMWNVRARPPPRKASAKQSLR
jgi:hypothetical protein